MVDVPAVPDRLEHPVRESEGQDVLHGLLAEVVVDAEHLRLVEDRVDDLVQLARALQVVPERLLQHDLRVLLQPGLAEPVDDVRVDGGWHGRVEEPAPLRAELGVDLLEVRREVVHRAGLRDLALVVRQTAGELVPGLALGRVVGELLEVVERGLPELLEVIADRA